MSPIGGVGVNLAVQDAVAAANILTEPLLSGTASGLHLAAVQRRRLWPTCATQRLQIMLQRRVIAPVLSSEERMVQPPAVLRWLLRIPGIRRLPARAIGLGLRREHIGTPEGP